jgi:hypothetical protein
VQVPAAPPGRAAHTSSLVQDGFPTVTTRRDFIVSSAPLADPSTSGLVS